MGCGGSTPAHHPQPRQPPKTEQPARPVSPQPGRNEQGRAPAGPTEKIGPRSGGKAGDVGGEAHPSPNPRPVEAGSYPPHPLEYDVFLTHDWGKDEHNMCNHSRVGALNTFLKKKGLVTWFDEDRMEGNIMDKMATGIDQSALVIVFITKRYVTKVEGVISKKDNCRLEFMYACSRKTAARMIPVVMEKRMADSSSWAGPVGMTLVQELYKPLWTADDGTDSNFLVDAEAIHQYILERFATLETAPKNSKAPKGPVPLDKQVTLKEILQNPKNHETPVEKEAEKVKQKAAAAAVSGNKRSESSGNLHSVKSQNGANLQSIKSQNGAQGKFMDLNSVADKKGGNDVKAAHPGKDKGSFKDKGAFLSKDKGSFKDQQDRANTQRRKLFRLDSKQLLERETLLERKLANSAFPLDLKQSVDVLTYCVERGVERAAHLDDKEGLILIGNTGAGKSTLANYLAGCEMVSRSGKQLGLKGLLQDVIVVKGTSEGGAMDELSPIGHSRMSKTFMPNIFATPPPGTLTFCDCPGFLDSRGAEINIANAVNIKTALGHAKCVRVIVLVSYSSLVDKRGQGVKEMLQICGHLFGSEKNISRHKKSILLGVTNAPPDMTRETIVEFLCEDAEPLLRDVTETLFLYDPLNRGLEDRQDRETLIKKIESLTPIHDPADIFQTVLTPSDKTMLVALVEEIERSAVEALSRKRFLDAAGATQQLGRLNVIEHPTLARLSAKAHKEIRQYFTNSLDKIRTDCYFERFESAQQLLSELEEAHDCFVGDEDLLPATSVEDVRMYVQDSMIRYDEREQREKEREESLARSQNLIQQMSEQLEEQQKSTRVQLQEQEDKFKDLLKTLEGRMEDTLKDKQATEAALKLELAERLKSKDEEIRTAADEERYSLQQERDSLRSEFEQKLKEAAEQNKKLLAQQEADKRLMEEKHSASLEGLRTKLEELDEQQKQAKKDLEARSEEQKRAEAEALKEKKRKEEEKAKAERNAGAEVKKKAKPKKDKSAGNKPDSYQYPDILKKGMRVVRGKNWKWNDQDGGEGKFGTVTDDGDGNGWFRVKWDADGSTNAYRYRPKDSIHDLKLASDEPTRLTHERMPVAQSEEASLVRCPKGHKTSDHEKSRTEGQAWVCDLCAREHGVGPCAKARLCTSCDWDACATCSKRLLEALVTSENCKAGMTRFVARMSLHEDKITSRITLTSSMREEMGKLGKICSLDPSDDKLSVKVKYLTSGKDDWWSWESLEKPEGMGCVLKRGSLLKVLSDKDLVQEGMKSTPTLKWSSDLKKYLGKTGIVWKPVLGDSACVTLRMDDEAEVEWPLASVEAVGGRTYVNVKKGAYYRVKDNTEAVKAGLIEMAENVKRLCDDDDDDEVDIDDTELGEQVQKYAGAVGRCVSDDSNFVELKHFDGEKCTWWVGCLEEVDAVKDILKEGDRLRIIGSEKRAKKLLDSQGGWVDSMKRQLGKTGVVKKKTARQIEIKVGEEASAWNWPYACVDVIKAGQKLDDDTPQESGLRERTVKVGMMLRVVSDLDAAKAGCKQASGVGWSGDMEKYTGWAGRVQRKDEVSARLRHHDGSTWWWGYKSLEKVDEIQHKAKSGEKVRITPRHNLAKKQQVGHGGWNTDMKGHLGKVAEIERVSDDGARLKYAGNDYYWNYSLMDTGKNLKELDLNSSDSEYGEEESDDDSDDTDADGDEEDDANDVCVDGSKSEEGKDVWRYAAMRGSGNPSFAFRHKELNIIGYFSGTSNGHFCMDYPKPDGEERAYTVWSSADMGSNSHGSDERALKTLLDERPAQYLQADKKRMKEWKIRWIDSCWFLENRHNKGKPIVLAPNALVKFTDDEARIVEKADTRMVSRKEGKAFISSGDAVSELSAFSDAGSASSSESSDAESEDEEEDSEDVCENEAESKEGKDVWRYATATAGGDLWFGFRNKEINMDVYIPAQSSGWFKGEQETPFVMYSSTDMSQQDLGDGEKAVKKVLDEKPKQYLQADTKQMKTWEIKWKEGCWFIENRSDKGSPIVLAPNALVKFYDSTARIMKKTQNKVTTKKAGKEFLAKGGCDWGPESLDDAESKDVSVDGSKSTEGKDTWKYASLREDGNFWFGFRNQELKMDVYVPGKGQGWLKVHYPYTDKKTDAQFVFRRDDGMDQQDLDVGGNGNCAPALRKMLDEKPNQYLKVDKKQMEDWKVKWKDGCWFIEHKDYKGPFVLARTAFLKFHRDRCRIVEKTTNKVVSKTDGEAFISRKFVNSDGYPVSLGTDSDCKHLYYCGQKMKVRLSGTDGVCGPNNGPQCPACERFQESWANRAGASSGWRCVSLWDKNSDLYEVSNGGETLRKATRDGYVDSLRVHECVPGGGQRYRVRIDASAGKDYCNQMGFVAGEDFSWTSMNRGECVCVNVDTGDILVKGNKSGKKISRAPVKGDVVVLEVDAGGKRFSAGIEGQTMTSVEWKPSESDIFLAASFRHVGWQVSILGKGNASSGGSASELSACGVWHGISISDKDSTHYEVSNGGATARKAKGGLDVLRLKQCVPEGAQRYRVRIDAGGEEVSLNHIGFVTGEDWDGNALNCGDAVYVRVDSGEIDGSGISSDSGKKISRAPKVGDVVVLEIDAKRETFSIGIEGEAMTSVEWKLSKSDIFLAVSFAHVGWQVSVLSQASGPGASSVWHGTSLDDKDSKMYELSNGGATARKATRDSYVDTLRLKECVPKGAQQYRVRIDAGAGKDSCNHIGFVAGKDWAGSALNIGNAVYVKVDSGEIRGSGISSGNEISRAPKVGDVVVLEVDADRETFSVRIEGEAMTSVKWKPSESDIFLAVSFRHVGWQVSVLDQAGKSKKSKDAWL